MPGCKNQLVIKYNRKLLVSCICHIEFTIYMRKFTIVNILGGIPFQEIQTATSTYKVSIKFSQNIPEELLKIEYLFIHSQYFGNLTQEFFVVWPDECLCKISKTLLSLIRYSTLKSLPFMFCQNLTETLWVAVAIYISQ